jgi:hypothetical protein
MTQVLSISPIQYQLHDPYSINFAIGLNNKNSSLIIFPDVELLRSEKI